MAPSLRDAHPELQAQMDEVSEAVNRTIERLLPETDLPEAPLYDAMRHGTLNGGKRLRPFLAIHSANLFNVDTNRSRRTAAAIEFVHCYSLIHDDHPNVRCHLVRTLAQAAGGHGMVGGQMLDLIGETEEFDLGTISRLQRMKTGKLMAFACESGAILGKANDVHRRALCNYAHDLGLAFQVTDDILDVEADPQDTGKDTGKDEAAGKATFVSTMGKDAARGRAEMLVHQAISHLKIFEGRGETLKELALYVLERRA